MIHIEEECWQKGHPKEMWEIGNSYFKFFLYALLDMQEKETGKLG